MGKKGNSSKDDPLSLHSVDREIHIEKLKRQIKDIAGDNVVFGPGNCDPELQAAFLEQVLAFESQERVRPLDALTRDGLDLPPARKLTDAALKVKLWEIIRALAERHAFLECTDHLNDRELYTWLLDVALREECTGFGMVPGEWHLDVLGGCSEEDLILTMRYYANNIERERWAAEFPDFPMPPREKPPYDRDRLLPHPEPPR